MPTISEWPHFWIPITQGIKLPNRKLWYTPLGIGAFSVPATFAWERSPNQRSKISFSKLSLRLPSQSLAGMSQKWPLSSLSDLLSTSLLNELADFSKYRLAKAYLRWTRKHCASDLAQEEVNSWVELIEMVNRGLA